MKVTGQFLKIQCNCLLTDWVWEETGEPGGNPRRHGANERALRRHWPLSHHAALRSSMRVLTAQLPRSPENHAKETQYRTSLHKSWILIIKHSRMTSSSTRRECVWSNPFFFFLLFVYASVSAENQRTLNTSAVLQNGQQLKHKKRWLSLTVTEVHLRTKRTHKNG